MIVRPSHPVTIRPSYSLDLISRPDAPRAYRWGQRLFWAIVISREDHALAAGGLPRMAMRSGCDPHKMRCRCGTWRRSLGSSRSTCRSTATSFIYTVSRRISRCLPFTLHPVPHHMHCNCCAAPFLGVALPHTTSARRRRTQVFFRAHVCFSRAHRRLLDGRSLNKPS